MIDETSAILKQIGQMQRNLAELKASLAEKWTKETIPSDRFDVFVCRARGGYYGLPVNAVFEVLPMCRLKAYPEAPSWFSGLLKLRGQMIPVLDVTARIDRARRAVDVSDFIVVVNVQSKRVGLVFQDVFQIVSVDGTGVQPPINDVPEALYVMGIVKTEKDPIFLLSLSCLVGTSDLPQDV